MCRRRVEDELMDSEGRRVMFNIQWASERKNYWVVSMSGDISEAPAGLHHAIAELESHHLIPTYWALALCGILFDPHPFEAQGVLW